MTTLADLRTSCYGRFGKSPEYVAKQLHAIPDAPVVVREVFLLQRVQGKTVLDVGASGPMHAEIVLAAKRCYGIDRRDTEDVYALDLDDFYSPMLKFAGVELVVCGEVLEHLSNPGQFLDKLSKAYHVPTIFTVPNAFTAAGRRFLREGYENVNDDHCAWYSTTTLRTLLGRHGYNVKEWYWYKGQPHVAEGIIAVAETRSGQT